MTVNWLAELRANHQRRGAYPPYTSWICCWYLNDDFIDNHCVLCLWLTSCQDTESRKIKSLKAGIIQIFQSFFSTKTLRNSGKCSISIVHFCTTGGLVGLLCSPQALLLISRSLAKFTNDLNMYIVEHCPESHVFVIWEVNLFSLLYLNTFFRRPYNRNRRLAVII